MNFEAGRPKGLVLILHSGFSKINVDDCIAAIPSEWKHLDREKIDVDYSERLNLAGLYNLNFGQFALEHRKQFINEIHPLLEQRSDYAIIYFGLVPIPLAIDFGQLFNNYRNVTVYQQHHVSKQWYKDLENGSAGFENNELSLVGLPGKDQKGIMNCVVRVSISHFINPEATEELVPNAAEVDIALKNPNEDAIISEERMLEFSEAVKSTFDDLSENRSDLSEIHLFASVPCGLAFLIGSKISPTIHPYIQTYQYSRTEHPKYKKAILIKGQIETDRKFDEQQKQRAAQLRAIANQELERNIRAFCDANKLSSRGRGWLLGVIPDLDSPVIQEQFWNDLPPISDTSLCGDSIYLGEDTIKSGFLWRMDKWHIDDDFFISLSERVRDADDIKKAIRLFLFHEALHYKRHDLTDLTSANIGSFPKVLEIADYQADVYAILNEYGFYTSQVQKVTDLRQFFLDTIKVATETMWCFDDRGKPLTEIQIRRLNRYLNWYWQYSRIEKNGNNINEIVRILSEKPVIELNGLVPKEENNRFLVDLNKQTSVPLELGVFVNNKVVRAGNATNMPIDNLIKGIREMKGEIILDVLRSFLSR